MKKGRTRRVVGAYLEPETIKFLLLTMKKREVKKLSKMATIAIEEWENIKRDEEKNNQNCELEEKLKIYDGIRKENAWKEKNYNNQEIADYVPPGMNAHLIGDLETALGNAIKMPILW